MATTYYSQVAEALRKRGFLLVRQGKGSHEIWGLPRAGLKVTVPRNLKSRHTANGILKDAGCDDRV